MIIANLSDKSIVGDKKKAVWRCGYPAAS